MRRCAPFVLCGLATAAIDVPLGNEWRRDIDQAMAAWDGKRAGRKVTVSDAEIRALPTWSLPAVARAAAVRYGSRFALLRANIMTELERRRAKRLEREAEEADV